MHTAAYKVDVASDRRRRENVQGTFFVTQVARKSLAEKKEPSLFERTSFLLDFGEHCDNFRKN